MKRLTLIPLLMLFSAGASAQDDAAPTAPPAAPRPALMAAKAAQGRMLDITNAGSHLVAVGEEGSILLSSDGKVGRQSPSPTNVMLTRVRFSDENHGWALGYDASILQTSDGGKTWSLRHHDADGRALYDLVFLDAQHGIVVGAYGHVLETHDGGNTWTEQETSLRQLGLHLNVVLKLSDGSLLVAGERGLMARSRDAGATWQMLDSPYAGSYFGALEQGEKGLLVYGMRGNIFTAADLDRCKTVDAAKWDPDARESVTDPAKIAALGWHKIDSPSHESLFGALPLEQQSLLFVGINGTVLKLTADGTLTPVKTPAAETLVHAVAFNGRLIAVGRRGIQDLGALP